MKSRREFILGSAVGLAALGAGAALAEGKKHKKNKKDAKKEKKVKKKGKKKHGKKGYPDNIVYTTEKQGQWDGKAASHAPEIVVDGNKVTVKTNHGMSAEHYIVRHTLVSSDGEVLGTKTFSPSDNEAVSVYELETVPEHIYATSFCNLHDFWVTKI